MELWDLYNERRELTGLEHIRGEKVPAGFYHLVVHVWVRNKNGEYLISQRSADRPIHPLKWECIGGSALKGEDSLTAAIRETKEEVGLILTHRQGKQIYSIVGRVIDGVRYDDIVDVWLFEYDGPINLETATTKEVSQTRWMTKTAIKELFDSGQMVPTLGYFFELEVISDTFRQKLSGFTTSTKTTPAYTIESTDTTSLANLKLCDLQPSQFYISEKKLVAIEQWLDPMDLSGFVPIPIKWLDGRPVMTDGHTRAVAALRVGLEQVPLVLEEDELSWEMYRRCVAACRERGVLSPLDLQDRIIGEEDYQRLWDSWCDDMQRKIITERAISYVQVLFAKNADGHDAAHTLRVYRNAMLIAENEHTCDKEVVALAALLHDADDHKLFQTENNANARRFQIVDSGVSALFSTLLTLGQNTLYHVCKGERLGAHSFFFQPVLQLGYARFKLPQTLICDFDFSVEVAALGAYSALLHLKSRYA